MSCEKQVSSLINSKLKEYNTIQHIQVNSNINMINSMITENSKSKYNDIQYNNVHVYGKTMSYSFGTSNIKSME